MSLETETSDLSETENLLSHIESKPMENIDVAVTINNEDSEICAITQVNPSISRKNTDPENTSVIKKPAFEPVFEVHI